MEERQMTIAKGLGRIKTIRAQLKSIMTDLQMYSACNSKKRCNLGLTGNDSTKITAAETIALAQEKVNSLYQQYNDLTNELLLLKKSIDKTNAVTSITVAGKTMTIHEALIYKDEIVKQYDILATSVISCFSRVEREVEVYNNNIFVNAAISQADKNFLLADTIYLVNRSKVEEIKKWNNEFLSEINNELNAVNAVTQIIF